LSPKVAKIYYGKKRPNRGVISEVFDISEKERIYREFFSEFH
jgi:hypothetical protein